MLVWGRGSAVESICCSCRRSEFLAPGVGSSERSLTPATGQQMLSASAATCTQVCTLIQRCPAHIIKNSKNKHFVMSRAEGIAKLVECFLASMAL